MIKNVGKTKFKIILVLAISVVTRCAETEAAIKLECPQALKGLTLKNFGKIFTTKNPIPEKGRQKLFPIELTIPNADGQLPEPTPEQVTELMEKVLDFAKYLYKWRFLTKAEYQENYVFAIEALAQLPKKVNKAQHNNLSPKPGIEELMEAGNPYFPENAREYFGKDAADVELDDFISIIDQSWNSTDRKIRRSPDIRVIHPYWRRTGGILESTARYIGIVAVASIVWATLGSLNNSIKDPPSGEGGRNSYEALARMTLDNFENAPSRIRNLLFDFFVRKHGMFTWLEVEARDEYMQAQTFLMMKQQSLTGALELKNPALIKLYVKDLAEFEHMFPDVFTDPLGKRAKETIHELYKIFDPDGKIRAEYESQEANKFKNGAAKEILPDKSLR